VISYRAYTRGDRRGDRRRDTLGDDRRDDIVAGTIAPTCRGDDRPV